MKPFSLLILACSISILSFTQIINESPFDFLEITKIHNKNKSNVKLGVAQNRALGDIFFNESFDYGFDGDTINGIPNGTWTTFGNDGVGVVDLDAVWEYRGEDSIPDIAIGSRGAYAGTYGPIDSPTAANGFFIFDSDFLDNAGVLGAFGSGLSPTPHESWLVSPTFSTVGAAFVSINFSTFFRRYKGDAYVLLSIDGGTTWGDSVTIMDANLGLNFASSPDSVIDIMVNFIANQANVKIAFYFDGVTSGGGYYFVMIDDIKVVESPDHDMVLDRVYYQGLIDTGGSAYYTMIPAMFATSDTIQISGEVSNKGGLTQTGVKFNNVYTSPNGSTILSSPATIVASGNSDSLIIGTTVVLDQGIGDYSFAYSVSADSTDDIPADNMLDTVFVSVTDSTYARDFGADGNSWFGAGSTFEIGPLFTIFDSAKVTSVSIGLGDSSLHNETFSIYIYAIDAAGDFVLINSREFITYDSVNNAGAAVAYSVPEMVLVPGTYIVTYKTYTDKIYFLKSSLKADPQTVFVDPSASGSWYYTSAIPLVRLNLSSDLFICDLGVNVIRTGATILEAMVSNGHGPFAYVWSNGDTGIVTNNAPCSPLSDYTVTVTDVNNCKAVGISNICSIYEDKLLLDFVLYPNPTNRYFRIEGERLISEPFFIRVVDILGKEVWVEK